MEQNKTIKKDNNFQSLYLSLDHLKVGNYKINITLNNKVIKSVKLNKKI